MSPFAQHTADFEALCYYGPLCMQDTQTDPKYNPQVIITFSSCCGVWVQVYEQMEPAPEMLMSLLPFQKEFLAWAVDQERSEIRGGILADEMGMGKTIQVSPAPQTHILFLVAWVVMRLQAHHMLAVVIMHTHVEAPQGLQQR